MIIEGPVSSGKTEKLIQTYTELIMSGVSTSEILVITANKHKQKFFTDRIKANLKNSEQSGFGGFLIHTFNGIVYNSMINNWPLFEKELIQRFNNPVIIPNLCGLELTEYILRKSIDEINKDSNIELTFNDYPSNSNLIHQLLRRQRLIIENSLNEDEIQQKSGFLNERFSKPARRTLKLLEEKSKKLRAFDFLRQTQMFLEIYGQGQIKDYHNIKYLLADDFDELTYSAQSFVKSLLQEVSQWYIAGDAQGGARRGYLCAYPQGFDELLHEYKETVVSLANTSNIYKSAEEIFNSLNEEKASTPESFEIESFVKRIEMLDAVKDKIYALLNNGTKADDIMIINPFIEEGLKFSLIEFFDLHKIQYQFLTGTRRIIENSAVHGTLITLQLINDKWKYKPNQQEIRILLTDFLNIPLSICQNILEYYKKHKKLTPALECGIEEFDQKYKNYLGMINSLKETKKPFAKQLDKIFFNLILPALTKDDDLTDFNTAFNSYQNFMSLVNSMPDDEKPDNPEREWLVQLKNTVVTDNPPQAPELTPDAVKIATPQRAVDLELKSKYQIWTDISENYWIKDDTGPLYNSWVFQKNSEINEYTPEIHNRLTLNKTAHLLRKLVLLAGEKVIAYRSETDSLGNENTGELADYLLNAGIITQSACSPIIPRDDQKPVIDYEKGRLAVAAVPGAGKTTVLMELIKKLICSGIKPHEILVLTYMQSAAINIQDKLKNKWGLVELPYVNTIHGLASKIIRDEDNFVLLGLSSDFGICDDVIKTRIIGEVSKKSFPDADEAKKWIDLGVRAVSRAKVNNLKPQDIEKFIKNNPNGFLSEFLPIFTQYEEIIREKNLLDYDDLLVKAVELLKNHIAVRKFYQKRYKYIIEDEAQDSSKIQQELLGIISARHGNFVRCGDVNQAIMGTFTNADAEGFRDFIRNNPLVEMTGSQRSSKEIINLANDIVEWSSKQPELKNAFFDIKIQPVEGQNPKNENCVKFNVYDNQFREKEAVASAVKKLIEENPDYSIGVLLRTNPRVNEWTSYFKKSGINALCVGDTLNQKKVFRFLLKFLEVIENPWDNKLIIQLYEEFDTCGIINKDYDSFTMLNSLGSPFISFDPMSFNTQNLVRLWWDIDYWLTNSSLQAEELIHKIGSYYFETNIDISNVHLFAGVIKRFRTGFTDYSDETGIITLPDIIAHLKEISSKKLGGVRFFSEEEDEGLNGDFLKGYVRVMTLHKSKGLEFDAVFIPEMQEEKKFSYAITPDIVEIDENELFEKLNEAAGIEKKSDSEIKHEIIEETLRLIYVGITRAKKFLSLSAYNNRIGLYGKSKPSAVSKILAVFEGCSKVC